MSNEIAERIAKSIIRYVVKNSIHVAIYVVENFENLFDYQKIFTELSKYQIIRIGENESVTLYVDSPYVSEVESSEPVVIALFNVEFLNPQDSMQAPQISSMNNALTSALASDNQYIIIFTTSPMIVTDVLPAARYAVTLPDIAPLFIRKHMPRKEWYARVMGFTKVLSFSVAELEEYLRRRKLATPHTVGYVKRSVRSFDDLALDDWLARFLRTNILIPLQKKAYDILPSVMFIGVPGVGKTTIAYAIGRSAGMRVVEVKTELMGSKWLGESEKIANQTMVAVNDMAPVLVIFRNFETLLGSGGGDTEDSMTFERMKNIIFSWIRSPRRRFVAVFTVNNPKALKDKDLFDPALGTFKIPILPPYSPAVRRELLTRFIRKYASRFDIEFDPDDRLVSEALNEVSNTTFGYTPRELDDIAKIAINVALERGDSEVTREAILLARKYKVVDMISRAEAMEKTIALTFKVGITDEMLEALTKFRKRMEEEKYVYIKEEEERKKYAKITA